MVGLTPGWGSVGSGPFLVVPRAFLGGLGPTWVGAMVIGGGGGPPPLLRSALQEAVLGEGRSGGKKGGVTPTLSWGMFPNPNPVTIWGEPPSGPQQTCAAELGVGALCQFGGFPPPDFGSHD